MASGLATAKLLREFARLVQPIPEASNILRGMPGSIHEEALSWEVLAKLHYDDKRLGQGSSSSLGFDNLERQEVKEKKKKKKDKDKKKARRTADDGRSRGQAQELRGSQPQQAQAQARPGQTAKRARIDRRPSHLDRRG